MTGMDYSMGGGRVKYRELAVAAANQTYGAQLTQLKTTWITLSDEEKMRCAIASDDGLMLTGTSSIGGLFTRVYYSFNTNQIYTETLTLSSCKFASVAQTMTGTATPTDVTNSNHSSNLKLMILDVVSEE
jgi:hypothetical protein